MEWHQRLGHPGFDNIKRLAKIDTAIEVTGRLTNPTCEYCQLAKQTRIPNSNPGTHRATTPLDHIYRDVAGLMATLSLGGAKYFLLFMDDYSRHRTVYTIKAKSEVIDRFRQFKL